MDETTAALAQDTFDVLAFVEKTAYPTKLVTVFRDAKAAKDYADLVNERYTLEDNKQDTVEITERIEALGEQLSKSSITFELRGFPPGIVAEIQKKYTTEEDPEATAADNELIARAIITARNSEGIADPRTWTAEDVAMVKRFLVEGEFVKLLSGVAEVIFNAAVFDQAVDAGFSRGRPDVAAELLDVHGGTDGV